MVRNRVLFALTFIVTLILPVTAFAAEEFKVTPLDPMAPEVEHIPSESAAESGQDFRISARVTDNRAVKEVVLFYRTPDAEDYSPIRMEFDGADHYVATIPKEQVRAPNIEYYIKATDTAGNITFRAGKVEPLVVIVNQPVINGPGPINGQEPPPKKWWWAAGAAIAAAVVIGLAGGGGGNGGGGDGETGTVTVTAPAP